jgi:hypothetical protein
MQKTTKDRIFCCRPKFPKHILGANKKVNTYLCVLLYLLYRKRALLHLGPKDKFGVLLLELRIITIYDVLTLLSSIYIVEL